MNPNQKLLNDISLLMADLYWLHSNNINEFWQNKWDEYEIKLDNAREHLFKASEGRINLYAKGIPSLKPKDIFASMMSKQDKARDAKKSIQHALVKLEEVYMFISKISGSQTPLPQKNSIPSSKNIFIVYGHDELMISKVENFVFKQKYTPIVLRDQANGKFVLDKFEEHAADCCFAICLFSPDDEGGKVGTTPNPRPRPNVVFELGYFMKALGREKVVILRKGSTEIHSDIAGLTYTDYDKTDWQTDIMKQMKKTGLHIDFS